MVIKDTIPPLIKLSGTTANKTNVVTSVMAGLTFVPKSTMLAPEPSGSNGIPYILAKVGNKNSAFNQEPTTVIIVVPIILEKIALFLLFFNQYKKEAGKIKLQPTTKLAISPTKAVLVPFVISFKSILQNSIITPATGPNANPPTRAGNSLKSSL